MWLVCALVDRSGDHVLLCMCDMLVSCGRNVPTSSVQGSGPFTLAMTTKDGPAWRERPG